MTTGCFGLYRGICTNTKDPENFYRIKATVPQVFGNTTVETDWAWPVFPPGYSVDPLPGMGVWISFEGGDTEYPIWVGVWVANAALSPFIPIGAGGFLPLVGGTMSGPINMGSSQIKRLANGVASTDAAAFGQIPVIRSVDGVLANTYNVTASFVTFLTTASLAVGKWKLFFAGVVLTSGSGQGADIEIGLGTAVATFSGPVATGFDLTTVGAEGSGSVSFSTTVTVTTAGTIVYKASGSGVGGAEILAGSPLSTTPGATGYTGLQYG